MGEKPDFEVLKKLPLYNTLASCFLFDNSGGIASHTQNKTSIWLVSGGEGGEAIYRVCNISTTNIDGTNEIGLVTCGYQDGKSRIHSPVLPSAVRMVAPKHTDMYLNSWALQQLGWADMFSQTGEIGEFMGCRCVIDNSIPNNEDIVF
jgi:hypothetical protein